MFKPNPLHLGLEVGEGGTMKRGEFWSLRYRVHPYLSYLTMGELCQRFHDTFTNINVLNEKGQISVIFGGENREHAWNELWVDVMEEFGRRGFGIPSNIIPAAASALKPRAPRESKGVKELRMLPWDASNALIRFGSKAWLKETFESGHWRIGPASSYSAKSLNSARQDDEMVFTGKRPLMTSTENGPLYQRTIPDKVASVLTLRVEALSDYYLTCLSRRMIYRMFDDFEADSFIVIRNEQRFRDRMLKAFYAAKPGWHSAYGPVTYVDPFGTIKLPDIQFAKNFKYAYQEEYRFAWMRPYGGPKLEPIFIELGPLSDCCDYIEIDSE